MKQLLFLALLAAGLMAQPLNAQAAVGDFFLQLDGIDGETEDDRHKATIEIGSFNWGMLQQSTTNSSSGRVSFSDMIFTARASKASPKLMLACATGQHIASATLYVHRAAAPREPYLTYKLSDILISSYQTSGSGGTLTPTDSFSLSFSKVTLEHTGLDGAKTTGVATRPPNQ